MWCKRVRCLLLASLVVLSAGCQSYATPRRASVLDFLFPEGTAERPAQDVELVLPLRVGIAFAPAPRAGWDSGAFDEAARRALCERIAAAFRGVPEVESVQVLPTSQLAEGGGFANLDQLAALYGLDLAVLLSYEQVQFTDQTLASITYWTIVGAYVVEGDRNETSTLIDATVLDIRSRALLFNATGTSKVEESATAIDAPRVARETSLAGFEQATDQLITQLGAALDAFREQAKTGTVRGRGTPAVRVTSGGAAGGAGGAGAFGPWHLLAVALLAAGVAARRR